MPREIRLRNIDYTDRELLAVIERIKGKATTTEIAIALGISTNGNKGVTPARRVSTRLAWMRRYGFLDRFDPDPNTSPEPGGHDSSWEVTAIGKQLISGKLSAAVTNAIDRSNPGNKLLMMRQLTRRGYVEAEASVATALRREYQHQVAQRS